MAVGSRRSAVGSSSWQLAGAGKLVTGGAGLPEEIRLIERDKVVQEFPVDVRGEHQGDDAVVEAAEVADQRVQVVRGEDENERPSGNPGGECVRPQSQLGIGDRNAVVGYNSRSVKRQREL